MRLAFAGTPEFAAVALRALVAAGHQVVRVLTQPDRPAGRGMALSPSEVKQVAQAHGLPLAQPRSLKLDGKYADDAQAARATLEADAPELMVVAAYGLILPAWVLALPARGCLNIHASLLPRWRGAAPIHRAIEAGDAETGITLMQMDEGLDTGAMIATARTPIGPQDTTARLHDRLAALGAELCVRTLAAPGWHTTPQPPAGVTYARKVDKAEAAIDWQTPAAQIERRARAFDPFPGLTFRCGGDTLKLWRAQTAPGEHGAAPGTVLRADAQALRVACGLQADGAPTALDLQVLQRPGGKRLEAPAWARQQPGLLSSRLG